MSNLITINALPYMIRNIELSMKYNNMIKRKLAIVKEVYLDSFLWEYFKYETILQLRRCKRQDITDIYKTLKRIKERIMYV